MVLVEWVGQRARQVACQEKDLAPRSDNEEFSPLTAREWEIAQRIADGLDNVEIAERLSLSRATVATHVAKILKKLRHKSRVQVAVWVTEKRLERAARLTAVHQADLISKDHRLDAVAHLELVQDSCHVRLHGRLTD